ncbi:MAG: hypothetical protein H5T41_02605 [Methanomassiliicoccales archaeon]|nr:hypothetical protein [Methanomassiliicoccales archaeon]
MGVYGKTYGTSNSCQYSDVNMLDDFDENARILPQAATGIIDDLFVSIQYEHPSGPQETNEKIL